MPATKMVDIEVLETSGVDHPAHLHEGFAVMKSADSTNAKAVMAALGKDRTMGTNPNRPAAAPTASSEAIEKAVGEAVQKAIDTKLQPILDGIAQSWKDLRAVAEETDSDTPSTEGTPAADPAAAAEVLAADALLKSADLPDAVRQVLTKQRNDIAKAATESAQLRADIAKERDTRLDSEAIAKSRDAYPHLTVNHAEVAPALRKMALIDPAGHEAIVKSLVAAEENAKLGGGLGVELGTADVTKSTGYQNVETLAKALVNDGKFDTIQKARAHLYETRPELVTATREEK